ncbi:Josephin-domain-containing protein [Lanmaoa asiatica]|nr:Josephin-domain-containing protein [Lanmaoa asiatica]
MAGLEGLQSLIYHEAQQYGSMLCAQHALNSLLRTWIVALSVYQICSPSSYSTEGNYVSNVPGYFFITSLTLSVQFTAPDLSELANHLDHLEQSYNEGIRGQASANMDDTGTFLDLYNWDSSYYFPGFFSVQVLEDALHVWGLSLVRWRSEVMKPYHNRPHTQLAFVLNQNQHWYTLRRFGNSEENGHWFNLDSAKSSPQWVSKTYLGMFLQQAEQDGYSIFVVVPIDPSTARPLPRTDADDVASTLPESSSAPSSESRVPSSEPGLEDEDMDLQAALQASLASAEQGSSTSSSGAFNRLENYPSPVIPSSRTFPGFPPEFASSVQEGASGGRPNIPPNQDRYGNADVDPVSASMERNRIIMERMRQEQEAALQEQYEEEIAQFGQAQDRHSRQRREVGVEAEDELFRRAMEESLAEHHAQTGDDAEVTELGDGEDYDALAPRPNTHTMDRVYDDDDAELQAALKASLETLPPGFTLPPNAQPPPPQRLTNEPLGAETSASRPVEESEAEIETETETETDAEGMSGETAQAAREEVNIEEMRRRRLARFGG